MALFCLSSHACIPGASAFMTNGRKMSWTKFPLSRQLFAKVTKESLWVMKKLRKVTLYNYLWPRRLNYKLHMQRYCLKHQKLWENYSEWPMDNVYISFIQLGCSLWKWNWYWNHISVRSLYPKWVCCLLKKENTRILSSISAKLRLSKCNTENI